MFLFATKEIIAKMALNRNVITGVKVNNFATATKPNIINQRQLAPVPYIITMGR